MIKISHDTQEGYEFTGKSRTVSINRVNFFSGGFPQGTHWPAKNIHTDLESARKCGLQTLAVSGAMFEGYLIDLMIEIFGESWFKGGKMDLVFLMPVDKDEVLIPKAKVQTKKQSDKQVDFTLQIWCENSDGAEVTVGTAYGSILNPDFPGKP